MNDKPSLPRKGAIALGTIWVLKDLNPKSIMEFAIAGCITLIAVIAITYQWNLDREKEPPKPPN